MAGDQRPFQLRQHGVVESEDAGPDVTPVGEGGQQVLPEFRFDAALHLAGRP